MRSISLPFCSLQPCLLRMIHTTTRAERQQRSRMGNRRHVNGRPARFRPNSGTVGRAPSLRLQQIVDRPLKGTRDILQLFRGEP